MSIRKDSSSENILINNSIILTFEVQNIDNFLFIKFFAIHFFFQVVRARTLTNIPPAYKEILYMTRQISSAVCRNPEIYREVCENILRVDINVLKRKL